MEVLFVNGVPALLIKKERVLVAGDLHIGIEGKMKEKGLFFSRAAERMAEELLAAFEKSGAKSIALLGDIKDNVSYSSADETASIKNFFSVLQGMEIRLAKGNHDAYLERIFRGQHIDVVIEKEILLSETALMHGNFWPSDEAMKKDFIVTGHGHIAADVKGRPEKAWLIAGVGSKAKERYSSLNKNVKLVVAPAFNRLITGTRINRRTKEFIPLLNGDVFDFYGATVYDLNGEVLGRAGQLIEVSDSKKTPL